MNHTSMCTEVMQPSTIMMLVPLLWQWFLHRRFCSSQEHISNHVAMCCLYAQYWDYFLLPLGQFNNWFVSQLTYFITKIDWEIPGGCTGKAVLSPSKIHHIVYFDPEQVSPGVSITTKQLFFSQLTSSVTLNLLSKATNFCLKLGCCNRKETSN